MSWRADQIYALPHPAIIDFFRNYELLKNKLFLVGDLDGIRSEWTRSFMLSDNSENKERRHSLPEGGLLVIAPSLYRTGYDKDSENLSEGETVDGADKWLFFDMSDEELSPEIDKLSQNMEFFSGQLSLFNTLYKLNEQTHIPFHYYKCEMWAGDIEEEYSVVFDKGIFLYSYDTMSKVTKELITGEKIRNCTPLQKGFSHLNLFLPTRFFALHETSFDWKRYKI